MTRRLRSAHFQLAGVAVALLALGCNDKTPTQPSLDVAGADVGFTEGWFDGQTVSFFYRPPPGSDESRPPRTVAPTTIAAAISTRFLMMYCPSSVGA